MSAFKQKFPRKEIARARERCSSLVEMMIASLVLLVGIVPLAGVFSVAVATNSGRGDIATRTTLNAQDKMEQLLALSFPDGSSNTTVYPTDTTAGAGGTGLGGVMAGRSPSCWDFTIPPLRGEFVLFIRSPTIADTRTPILDTP